jgi:hypothetical protein
MENAMKQMATRVMVIGVLACCAVARADDATAPVQIKKWKADPVELLDKPDGKVVISKPAADMPQTALRTGEGWLKVSVGGKDYYVDASQARTDLKLSGKPKCDTLNGATGQAASRGLGDEGCEP